MPEVPEQERNHGPIDRLINAIKAIEEPVTVEQVVNLADEMGVAASSERALRRELIERSAQIDWPVRSSVVAWSDEPLDRSPAVPDDGASTAHKTVSALLSEWLAASAGDKERIQREVTEAISREDSGDNDRQLARAVGADTTAADWNVVPVDAQLAERLNEHLVAVAEKSEADEWLLRAALALSGKARSAAVKALRSLDAVRRSELCAEALTSLFESNDGVGVSASIRQLKGIAGNDATPLLARRILDLIADRRVSTLDPESRSRTATALAVLILTVAKDNLDAEMNRHTIDHDVLRDWLVDLAAADVKDQEPRLEVLSTIGGSAKRAALSDARVFGGLDLEQLGALLAEPWADSNRTEAFRTATRTAAAQATGNQVGGVLAAVSRWPVLEDLVPVDRLRALARRDESGARVLRRVSEQFVDDAVAKGRDHWNVERESLVTQLAHADARLRELTVHTEEQQRRIDSLELKERDRSVSQVELRAAEVRQARVDVLRSLARFARSLRSTMSVLGHPDVLIGVVTDVERQLNEFGVEMLGEVGEHVPYDPEIHERIDGAPGERVEVIAPGYRLADSVTPLVYAQVR